MAEQGAAENGAAALTGERLAARLGDFAALLRAAGLAVGPGELVLATRALEQVDVTRRDDFYWALRLTMARSPRDVERFDRAFELFFERAGAPAEGIGPEQMEAIAQLVPKVPVPDPPSEAARPRAHRPAVASWSEVELLRHKDFAGYTPDEQAQLRRLMEEVRLGGPWRRTRRLRPAHGAQRGRPDLRRTLRASFRHGGEPLERHWRRPGERQRPLVLVCDISGSMAPYSRALLQYLHAAVAGRRQVEAYAFGTRLTRLTSRLLESDPDRALDAAAAAVEDWAGGTRIGDCLGELNRELRRHGRLRSAVVVIASDGWDRGDPLRLADEMARLHRSSHRIVWVNPLKGRPGYEPLARGMRAALPWCDTFLEGHDLASLERLGEVLAEAGSERPARAARA